ncbi:immunoglobulin lambda light chain variable region, incomplete match [Sciurus carolinensis]|nr:immunoglobulin lambda light chain variable region, incomplete match [Sciurus carolinensis]
MSESRQCLQDTSIISRDWQAACAPRGQLHEKPVHYFLGQILWTFNPDSKLLCIASINFPKQEVYYLSINIFTGIYYWRASVKLTCIPSVQNSTYFISWYQQQPGKAPVFLMDVNSDGSHKKGNVIPDRFSGSSSVSELLFRQFQHPA